MTKPKQAVTFTLTFREGVKRPDNLQKRHDGARRPDLVGLTVRKAVGVINAEIARYPNRNLHVVEPITIGGQDVKINSRRILRDGDELTMDP